MQTRAMKYGLLVVLIGSGIAGSRGVRAATNELRILPSDVTLRGPEARQTLIAQRMEGEQFAGLPKEPVTFSSSDPDVVTVVGDELVALQNGHAVITAVAGKQTASIRVRVADFQTPQAWSFRHHVEPILAKLGCSTGACHGALAGKGGFRLSLRGYDPESDHHTITRQSRGRRIELSDPGRSLLLAKPTGAIRHKGGLRFDVDSYEYKVLSEWIAQGATGPRPDDTKLERIEVLPRQSTLRPESRQRLLVRAYYSDGQVEDVTRWAKFDSTDERVAAIDQDGSVEVLGHGQAAMTAWFSSRIVLARVTSPFPHEVAPEQFADAGEMNFIDDLVLDKLKELNLPPSPKSSDSEFLRRIYLDTIGVLPTVTEVREFLADDSLDKRDRLIDQLLCRDEFVDYWTYKWSDILLIDGRKLRPEAVKAYYDWIRQRVADNLPWDRFVREILTATGNTVDHGATNFYVLHQDPESLSENACQAFLGLSIGCAKCHNHPLEKWTNDQYYAMANLFSRVRAKGWGGDARSGDGRRLVYVVDRGDLIQPLRGKPQPPTPLDGEAIPFESTEDRRLSLATWLTASENPYFARAITNRIWANFFGVGLVEPADDMRVSNPASNEALLDAAANYVVENRFDLKVLMREIMRSETYQRSSLPLAENQSENRFYTRYYPRRLMAEVMLDAICQVTGVPTSFTHVRQTADFDKKTDAYPVGTRALQLYDSAVRSDFLKTFGRNERQITCDCERSNEPSMVQVLHLSNGDTINDKLRNGSGRVAQLLKSNSTIEQIVDEAFLAALCRLPTPSEKEAFAKELSRTNEQLRREVIEDLFWGILSSREFLFNH